MSSQKLELIRSSRRLTAKPAQGIAPRGRQQVAAVCFRILTTGVQFLLVRTRRGRWIFPKGGVQAGLTHAQSAALEAYEEAGVHGRIEETAFTCYKLRKLMRDSGDTEHSIHAHLCEVLQLGTSQEPNRNPTWYSSAQAKRRLAEGRTREDASELARVVDRALSRIWRFPGRSLSGNDPLLKVKFESLEIHLRHRMAQARIMPPADPVRSQVSHSPAFEFSAMPRRGKLLQLRPVQVNRQ